MQPLNVALIYNLKRVDPTRDDAEAEFDSPSTIEAIRGAIASLGHHVVLLEARDDLPAKLLQQPIDVAFNVAEGQGGRSRESLVPALLELYAMEYTGSDATTLSVTLDKSLAKRVVAQAEIATAPFALMFTGRERLPKTMSFPAIVKPNAEGSSKGVFARSIARDEAELREIVRPLTKRYPGGVLVESFLSGREFTVGLLGSTSKPRVLPIMEVIFEDQSDATPIYTFEHKTGEHKGVRFEVPAEIAPKLETQIAKLARRAYQVLGCRDVARVDVRCDERGVPCFIECNPLPGLTPGWSDLVVIADKAGMNYEALIAEILRPATRRFAKRPKRAGTAASRANEVATPEGASS